MNKKKQQKNSQPQTKFSGSYKKKSVQWIETLISAVTEENRRYLFNT